MLPIRYINNVDVQGWEPSLDGSDDADLFALDLPSNFSCSPAILMTTRATNAIPENTLSISRRQAPSSRAQAAAYSSANAFVDVARSGESSHLRQVRSSTPRSATKSATAAPSARNAAAAGRSGGRPRSSTERKIARKLAENADYVPRPRNSFILFRTEFVAKRAGDNAEPNVRGAKRPKADRNGDEEDEESQSLSKQASAIWNNMDEEEKQPWAERAKIEKAEHEAKYPNYRYKPVRQGSARKNTSVIPKSITHGRRSSPRRVCSEASPLAVLDKEDLAQASVDVEQLSGVTYCPPASNISGAVEMPAPMRLSSLPALNPASSSLANALGSPTPTPERAPAQIKAQAQSSGPTIPTVPRVPALDLSASGSSCATGLPSIPRSPSAPIFDTRLISQFPQHHFTTAGLFQDQAIGVSLYPFRNLAARPTSCPSTPQTEMRTTSPLSPGSPTSLQSALPTPEDAEAEYFCNSGQYGHAQAGPVYEFLSQQLFTVRLLPSSSISNIQYLTIDVIRMKTAMESKMMRKLTLRWMLTCTHCSHFRPYPRYPSSI